MDAPLSLLDEGAVHQLHWVMQHAMYEWLASMSIKVIGEHLHTLWPTPSVLSSALGRHGLMLRERHVTHGYGVQRTLALSTVTHASMATVLDAMLSSVASTAFISTHPQSLPCIMRPSLTLGIDRSTIPQLLTVTIQFRLLRAEFLLPKMSIGCAKDPLQALQSLMIRRGFFIAQKCSTDPGEWKIVAYDWWQPIVCTDAQAHAANRSQLCDLVGELDRVAAKFERFQAFAGGRSYYTMPHEWRVSYEDNDHFALWCRQGDLSTWNWREVSPLNAKMEAIAIAVREVRREIESMKAAQMAAAMHADESSSDAASAADSADTLAPRVDAISLSDVPEQQ
jgi:hypothetical protein